MSTEFTIPGKIITGSNAVVSSEKYIAQMGKKALVVTGKVVVKLDCFGLLTDMLKKSGIEYVVFTGITNEPTDLMINEGVEVYKKENCDFIIGIGGGSPLDSIKAIAVLAADGGSISAYMGKTITGDLPPMVAIPTTAGTGSEATQFTVITDSKQNIKMLLKGTVLIPDLAIIDPYFTMTSPKNVTAATGLDALTHAIESYTSVKAQPLTDAVAVSAVKRIFTYLPIAYNDGQNEKARSEMSIAALEAGMAINNASVTLVHGMSRPIGAMFHVSHGISNAMLLEKCLTFALDGAYSKFADLAREIGAASKSDGDIIAAKALISEIGKLCRICEIPTLEQYGIVKEEFFSVIEKMAYDAIASGSPSNTIKKVTEQDVIEIYKSLW